MKGENNMIRRTKLWSYALAGALAVSNLSVVAAPFSSIVAQAAVSGFTIICGSNKEVTEAAVGDILVPAGDASESGKKVYFYYKVGDDNWISCDASSGVTVKPLWAGKTITFGAIEGDQSTAPDLESDTITDTKSVSISSYEPTVTYAKGNTDFTIAGTYSSDITVTNLDDKLPAPGEVFSDYEAEPGYTFYWNDSTNDELVPGTSTYANVTYNNAAATIAANKVPNSFTVKFAGMNKTDLDKTYKVPLSSRIEDPTKEHSTFLGWDLNGDTEVDINKDVTTDIQSDKIDAQYLLNIADTDETNDFVTMTALWDEAEKYTITYDANGAADITFDADEYYSDEDSVTLLNPTAQLTAVDFKGWSTNPKRTYRGWNPTVNDDTDFVAGSPSATFVDAGLGSVTLYAIYQKKDVWTLSFDKNNGTGPDIEDVKVIDGENATLATIDPTKYERTGYHIDDTNAWNTEADGSGTSYANAETYTPVVEDATFYVNWKPNEYTINYDENGGSGTTAETKATYGVDVKLAANGFTAPSATQEFAGWDRDKDAANPEFKAGDSVINLATGATDDNEVTLYAIWATKTGYMTINYYGNGGTGTMASEKGVQLPHAIAASTFTKTHFSQSGWDTDSSATTVVYGLDDTISTSATTTVDLYAVWEGNALTVEFDPNDGEGTMLAQKFYAGEPTKLSKNEFKYAKHKHKGWAKKASATTPDFEDEGDIEESDIAASADSLYLYAIWEDLTDVIDAATTKAAAAKADPTTQNITDAENALEAAAAAGASEEDLKTAKDDIQVAKKAAKEEARQAAITAAGEANKAAQEADKAADEADDAAEAVKKNPTAENIAEAKAKAKNAEDAAAIATEKANVATEKAKATDNASAKQAAEEAADLAKTAAGEATTAASAARDAAQAAEDEMSKEEAIAAANKAAATPTAENIKAAQDAIAAAEAKGATSDDLKDAKANLAKAEDEAKKNEKAADGSAAGAPAAEGTELVDANGNKTGFKVTDANASAPEVEYEGPADKNATKADIPEIYTDLSGNVYKVVGIDARAFKDTKVKTVTIRKNIKRIDPKAFEKSKVKNVKIKGTKLTKKMAKSFKKLKKGGKIKCSGSHKKNKEILNNLSTVKNGKTKVK